MMYKPMSIVSGLVLLASASAASAHEPPTRGWTMHIDAKRHIPGDLEAAVHHYCKGGLPGGVTECQLYDGDGKNARLIGIEVVVDAQTYAALPEAEKRLWHYHKEEVGRADHPVLPEMSGQESAAFPEGAEETYGKIFLVWDTSRDSLPLGQPQAYAFADNAAH